MSAEDEVAALRVQLDVARDELERLRLTLAVVGTVDLDAAILNRNGILEAIDRGRRWQARRGDVYGVLVASFVEPRPAIETDVGLVRHIAATITAGVREVDEVGKLGPASFAAVLMDLQPGSIEVVARRVTRLLGSLVAVTPVIENGFRLGAVEVMNTGPGATEVLGAAETAASAGVVGDYRVERL